MLKHAKLGCEVTSISWDDKNHLWRISFRDLASKSDNVITAKYVISCVGALHQPRLPDIPGVGRFRGPTLHSAKWDSSVKLEGKTVAIVGTGASCVQVQ